MDSVKNFLKKVNTALDINGRVAFLTAFVVGLLTHMAALTLDAPNHDGLYSMYFDQNMITSGRWFLGPACGISGFYSIPWLTGLLAMLYISVSAVMLVKVLEVTDPIISALIAGMLITFPSLASNFAYVFTMDGYMLGLLFAILSVFFVERKRFGFLIGALFLAFSMGIYQAYLPVAMLLCLYKVLSVFAGSDAVKEKIKKALNYLYMGALGAALYYIILKVMLLIEGKELDTYQGINDMAGANTGIISTIKEMYADFVIFVLRGKILFANVYALAAVIALFIAFCAALVFKAVKSGWFKCIWFYVISLVTVLAVPVFTNIILLVSPNVTYHLLMRYQYAFFGILALAFIAKVLKENASLKTLAWVSVIASLVIVFSYSISDNVAYSNLEKKYEKTYAYCLRLADRIEQTEGYEAGMPIYMIGVVGTDNFPVTDITQKVTDHMIGISGDYLLYTPENYEFFYKYYLGITFNFLRPYEANYYDSSEYVDMPSFPETGSTKVVDGVLYVKTENMH